MNETADPIKRRPRRRSVGEHSLHPHVTLPPPSAPLGVPWIDAIRRRDLEDFKSTIADGIRSILDQHNVATSYEILFLYDDVDDITGFHSNQLYKAAKDAADRRRDLLLLVHSRGGRIEPAYVASKTLKRLSNEKFSVVVPRKAKSAATLIALGADEIHMGMISELGPIDPQIGDMPALALANALEMVADMAQRFPDASEMLGRYITEQAPLRVLGYLKRVSESASQYAERLLANKAVGNGYTVAGVADHLVNHYKDHSFVIDSEEASLLLGPMIKENTAEYDLADELYEFLDLVSFRCRRENIDFWLVGAYSNSGWRLPKNET